MKKEIDRLLTEEIPKLMDFGLVTSLDVKGRCYMFSMQNNIKQGISL